MWTLPIILALDFVNLNSEFLCCGTHEVHFASLHTNFTVDFYVPYLQHLSW